MSRWIIYLLLPVILCGCGHGIAGSSYIPEAPDYSDAGLWYTDCTDTAARADVFYVLPTCIFDWEEKESGLPCHHYDVYGGVMKDNFDWSLRLADDIFGNGTRFFAPYYRQISLDSWKEEDEVVEERFSLAMSDVEAAFDYYLRHLNGGRDFILAGFSQGAKAVLELVKSMDAAVFPKMKAAYVIGYKLTDEDLACPNVRPAQGETDQGVVVSYNSVRGPEDIWPAVAEGTRACINPVNWSVGPLPAQLNDSVAVQVDTLLHVLKVSGYDGGGMSIDALDGQVPPGNYHLSELTLYRSYLHENVKKRLSAE